MGRTGGGGRSSGFDGPGDGHGHEEARPSPLVISIVLSYQNYADTDECLRSLVTQDYGRHQVVLVDNASADDSLARLKAAWGDRIRIVANATNLGVAGGYNAGTATALEAGADYVTLCNNDIVVDGDFVSSMVAALEARPTAAAVSPVILYHDRPNVIWFAGASMSPTFGLSRKRRADRRWAGADYPVGTTYPTDWLTTCATLVRARVLRDIGLLDERLFYGFDDVDWCLCARERGYECLILARPLVRHKVSVTSGARGKGIPGSRTAYTIGLGSVLTGAKHFIGVRGFTFLAALLVIRVPGTIFVLARGGGWRSISAYLRGVGAGLWHYGRDFFRQPHDVPPDS